MTLQRYLVSCHDYDVITGRNRLVVWRVVAVSAAAAIEGIRGTRPADDFTITTKKESAR